MHHIEAAFADRGLQLSIRTRTQKMRAEKGPTEVIGASYREFMLTLG
jgi:hypothetical protein